LKKLKGGSLYLTLTVGLLMLTILLYINGQIYFLKTENQFKNTTNYLLINQQGLLTQFLWLNTEDNRELNFNENEYLINLKDSTWGIYRLVNIKSSYGSRSIERSMFLGTKFNDNLPAIFLKNRNSGLYVSGGTKIIGDVYSSHGEIGRSNAGNKAFMGGQLLTGKVIDNKNLSIKIPDLEEMISNLKVNLKEGIISLNTENVERNDSVENSFLSQTIIIYIHQPITLSGYIKGKVIVYSDSLVNISSTSYIDDAIIYAPTVKIEDGFIGNLQIFASKKIEIGKKVRLNYPSALLLFNDDSQNDTLAIIIDKGSIIEGFIFNYSEFVSKIPMLIKLDSTTFTGILYNSGTTWLNNSRVYGSIISENIMARTESSTYINHLIDVTIDRKKLPLYFVGPTFSSFSSGTVIMKWLE
jgi:hypothetical protein